MLRFVLPVLLGYLLITSFASFSQPVQWNYLAPNPFYFGSEYCAYMGDISFVDSLHGYASDFVSPRMLYTTDGGGNWQMIHAPVAAVRMQFLNWDTGWINDSYTVSRTTDGCATWTNVFDTTQNNHPGSTIWQVYFVDSLIGFVTGQYCLSKTTDGGNTWTQVAPWNIDSSWRAIYFLNHDTGWVFSQDSMLAKTTNGGLTWTAEKISYPLYTYDWVVGVHFYNANNGMAITNPGHVYKTNDGGVSWVKQTADTLGGDMWSAKFGPKGLIDGLDYATGNVYVSADTGNTWFSNATPSIPGLVEPSLFAVYFYNPLVGYSGSACLYRTLDGGHSWQANIPTFPYPNSAVEDIAWTSASTVIAANYWGQMQYPNESFDDGVNWIAYTTVDWTGDTVGADVLGIQNVNPTCYFVEGIDSGLYRYENGIQTLRMGEDSSFIYAKSADSFIVVADYNIIRTTDGGNTWTSITPPLDSDVIYSRSREWWDIVYGSGYPGIGAKFMNWDTGVVAYEDSSYVSHEFVTVNGGASWHALPLDTAGYIYSTKVAPQGGLYALRGSLIDGQGFYSVPAGFFRLDSNFQWQFINYIGPDISGCNSITEGPADFGWSYDNILWSSTATWGLAGFGSGGNNSLIYSLDNGVTWNTYAMSVDFITLFKRLPSGRFIAGGCNGSILEYDATHFNCYIKGQVFYDFNRNGILDGYDAVAPAYPVQVAPLGYTAFTGGDGNYVTIVDSGSYTLSTDTIANYHVAPASIPVVFTSHSGTSSGNNFALQPNDTSIRDLYLTVDEGCGSAPGFGHTTYIAYCNIGVQPIVPILYFIADPALTYDSAYPPVSSIRGDTLIWNFPVIYPLRNNSITMYTTLSANAQLGQVVTNTAVITPVINDNTPYNNYDTTSFGVFGSFDPNYKEVKPATVSVNQLSSQSILQYTIHFQNTGTGPTHFIEVKDQLSPQLDPATLHVITSSAPCDYHIENGNTLIFRFTNISLPDSLTDPVNSRGFITYIISSKAQMLSSDTIYNSATIYFDYNAPVTTVPAKTAVNPVATAIALIHGDLQVKVFPNPSNSEVHVESTADFTAKLFDLRGRPLFTCKSTGARADLNVNNLSSGIYYLQIFQDGKTQGYSVCVVNY